MLCASLSILRSALNSERFLQKVSNASYAPLPLGSKRIPLKNSFPRFLLWLTLASLRRPHPLDVNHAGLPITQGHWPPEPHLVAIFSLWQTRTGTPCITALSRDSMEAERKSQTETDNVVWGAGDNFGFGRGVRLIGINQTVICILSPIML